MERVLMPSIAIACPNTKLDNPPTIPQNQNLALRNQISAECALCKSYASVDSSIPNSISLTIHIPHCSTVKKVGLTPCGSGSICGRFWSPYMLDMGLACWNVLMESLTLLRLSSSLAFLCQ